MLALGLGGGSVTVPIGGLVEVKTIAAHLGALTGSNNTETPCFVAEKACTVRACKLVDITGVTGHTQNYCTMTIYNRGAAGTATTVVAARSTNATTSGITAKASWDVTLSGTAANLELAAGDSVTALLSEAGTGQDLGNAALTFAVSEAGSDEVVVLKPRHKIRVNGAYLTNQGAITAHTQNYTTVTVYNRGADGTGTATVASRSTDTATTDDVASKTPWQLDLSATPANLYVEAGETLAVKVAKAGTGADLSGASITIDFDYATGMEV